MSSAARAVSCCNVPHAAARLRSEPRTPGPASVRSPPPCRQSWALRPSTHTPRNRSRGRQMAWNLISRTTLLSSGVVSRPQAGGGPCARGAALGLGCWPTQRRRQCRPDRHHDTRRRCAYLRGTALPSPLIGRGVRYGTSHPVIWYGRLQRTRSWQPPEPTGRSRRAACGRRVSPGDMVSRARGSAQHLARKGRPSAEVAQREEGHPLQRRKRNKLGALSGSPKRHGRKHGRSRPLR